MKLIVGLLWAVCVVLGFSHRGAACCRRGRRWARAGAGYFDKRPVRTILIIGNSRTYFRQMPETMRRMALYEDGDRPTDDGGYLSALMIYGFIYRDNFNSIIYQPPAIGEHGAQLIKSTVTDYYSRPA